MNLKHVAIFCLAIALLPLFVFSLFRSISTQVLILGAAKDTAVALRNILLAASQIQSRPKTDQVFEEIKTYENVGWPIF